MDKEKLSEKLNDFFGDKTVKVIMPKQFLANLSTILTKQNEEIIKALAENKINLTADFKNLLEENKKTRELLTILEKAIKENKIEKVEISNFPPQKEIKFPDIKIPEYPKEIEIKKPKWYEKFIPDKILEYIEKGFKQSGKDFENALDRHKELGNAFAVRLVDRDLQTFYNAILQAIGGGSGGFSIVGIKDVVGNQINPAINDKYTTLIDDFTITSKTYIGKAEAGSSEGNTIWQIKCIDETGNFAKIQWADGVDTFTKEWDERTNYTYS